MTPTILYQVDSFTGDPFRGNPAGVCITESKPSVTWMQNMAMEMNLSETAFIYPGRESRHIRFYTPEAEIDLCGHATLAGAHVLFEEGTAVDEIRFISKAGELITRKEGDHIVMDFPVYEIRKIAVTADFKEVTGIMPQELYRAGYDWVLALLKDDEEIRNITPDFSAMRNSPYGSLIVTSASSDREYDFSLRCFVPAMGINEDPVTGSAHCALVPFWHMKSGRTEFISHQLSKRSGVIRSRLKESRVEISGQAITIFKAELFV